MAGSLEKVWREPITQRCLAVVGVSRCEGKPEVGEFLCPTHCAQRDADKREYEVAIVDMSEFSDEWRKYTNQ